MNEMENRVTDIDFYLKSEGLCCAYQSTKSPKWESGGINANMFHHHTPPLKLTTLNPTRTRLLTKRLVNGREKNIPQY